MPVEAGHSSRTLDDALWTCICMTYGYGKLHQVSKATWYRHLEQASTQEEKQATVQVLSPNPYTRNTSSKFSYAFTARAGSPSEGRSSRQTHSDYFAGVPSGLVLQTNEPGEAAQDMPPGDEPTTSPPRSPPNSLPRRSLQAGPFTPYLPAMQTPHDNNRSSSSLLSPWSGPMSKTPPFGPEMHQNGDPFAPQFGMAYTQQWPLQPMRSGYHQSAYMRDPQQYQLLEERCKDLEVQMVTLKAERDTLNPLPAVLSASQLRSQKQLTPETHSDVKFWNRANWVKWSEGAENQLKSSRGAISYLEGENGEVININTVKAIRASMRDAWNELVRHDLSPASWGRASTTSRKLFQSLMEKDWPIFKLCNDGWKLDYLACVPYPGWKRAHLDDNGHMKKRLKNHDGSDREDDADDLDRREHDGSGSSGEDENGIVSESANKENVDPTKVDMPELPPSKAVEQQEQVPQPQKDATKKPKGNMRVPSEQSGRNLCARRWLKQVNNIGTKDEFDAYWCGVVSAAHRQTFTTGRKYSENQCFRHFVTQFSGAHTGNRTN
ncbi:hypothetical protein BU15DRAFT_68822 [Melanogaster broomeanus]|nr:hypothetical protein BU15DRAFT_68822 [Melanogaster broomeanus]